MVRSSSRCDPFDVDPFYRCSLSTTHEQRVALAEAAARRWLRKLEAMAISDASDEAFCLVHRHWMGAERAVQLQRDGARPPPSAQRS